VRVGYVFEYGCRIAGKIDGSDRGHCFSDDLELVDVKRSRENKLNAPKAIMIVNWRVMTRWPTYQDG